MNGSETSASTEPRHVEDGPLPQPRLRHAGLVQIFPRSLDAAPSTWGVRRSAVLGRSRDVDVRIDDSHASRRQAELRSVESGFRVSDLGSRHGTFVDGKPTEADGTLAAFGSVLRAGDTLLLAVEDVTRYQTPLRRVGGGFLGTQRDVIAGPVLWEAWQQATRVAALPHPVLIQGESGSGKEAIARLLHATRETKGPFVALNVAAIPEGLFESELFGHVRGAFTGAVGPRLGAFREAFGGVLFLDEVADLAIDLQVKLLRTIDQMTVRPLGASDEVPVDVRLVAATSRDLREACARGTFRLDLYYRLAGIVIEVPPLRERRDDIVALALSMLHAEGGKHELSTLAAEALVLAGWEGNVRQLHHAITQASVRALSSDRSRILLEDLSDLGPEGPGIGTKYTKTEVETAVRSAAGNVSLAAKALGVSRATLYNLFRRHGIDPVTLRAGKGA
jgi:transcriptional regulator of acetoin/glycerol metabolism